MNKNNMVYKSFLEFPNGPIKKTQNTCKPTQFVMNTTAFAQLVKQIGLIEDNSFPITATNERRCVVADAQTP